MTANHKPTRPGSEPDGGAPQPPVQPAIGAPEILIGRLIDGEASDDDRLRFELLAASEPQLWRALAHRLQDQHRLRDEFDAVVETMVVDLPEVQEAVSARRRAPWMLPSLGWAAAFMLAAAWIIAASLGPGRSVPLAERVGAGPVQPVAPDAMTFDEHFAAYLLAPNVIGELEPMLEEVETMTDGRAAVRYMRRVLEVAIMEPGETLPVNGFDPAKYRERVKVEPSPSD